MIHYQDQTIEIDEYFLIIVWHYYSTFDWFFNNLTFSYFYSVKLETQSVLFNIYILILNWKPVSTVSWITTWRDCHVTMLPLSYLGLD